MKSFEKIYSQNYQLLFRVAKKMVNDRDAAADIVQEVFFQFFTKQKEKRKIQYPKSWLYRAILNKCIDYNTDLQKFSRIDSFQSFYESENFLEDEELKYTLNVILSKLKFHEKKLLVLYSEGLTYKEIAEILEMKFTSVGKTLSRTLKKVEDKLKKLKYEVF